MILAAGFGWLKCRQDYQQHFGVAAPDGVCCYDLPPRLGLVRVALRLGWALPDRVLLRDEFHSGRLSVLG